MISLNLKRAIGYTSLVLLLSGCAIFPSMFDATEHARLTNIHVASADSAVCQDRDTAARVSREMYQDARWVWNYGQYLANNSSMSKMEQELMGMTQELSDRYNKPDAVSAFYCRSKFENIHRATTTILQVSARRPRS